MCKQLNSGSFENNVSYKLFVYKIDVFNIYV